MRSPVDKPLVQEEPLLGVGHIHMHVLVEASNQVKFVVVSHWLTPREFFRLAQRRVLKPFDVAGFRVEGESVADPTIVSAEDNDFRVRERE